MTVSGDLPSALFNQSNSTPNLALDTGSPDRNRSPSFQRGGAHNPQIVATVQC